MIIRMFEYDTQLALENKELISNFLTVRFPDSAIVSLRHTKNTPDSMTITVLTPGGKVTYTVPVLKIRQYTINELFEKKLFFLIPFHIFVYEKDFNELETNKKKLKQLEAEETTKSGIVLPGQAKEKPQEAEVIAVGPGGMVDGKEVKMQVNFPKKPFANLHKILLQKKFFNTKSGNHTPFRDPVTKSQYDFRFCYSFNYSFNISQNTLFKLKMSA